MTSLRKFPHPYDSMLAIQNDIDGTDLRQFEELHRFLNTEEVTEMGVGVGLDIADSFWMYNLSDYDIDDKTQYLGPEDMSYWSGHNPGRVKDAEAIRRYISCGWIDSIHSFGDFSRVGGFERDLGLRALDELKHQGIKIPVWINHGDPHNDQNFDGRLSGKFYGDVPDSTAYHTDATLEYGIKYIWTMTSSKNQLGCDSVIQPLSLWDGQQLWEFKRFQRHRAASSLPARLKRMGKNAVRKLIRFSQSEFGVSKHKFANFTASLSHPERLDEQLSESNLGRLIQQNLYSVIGQHLGCRDRLLPDSAIRALRRLRRRQDRGEILVARTSRLLEYNRVSNYLEYTVDDEGDSTVIDITCIDDPILGASTPELWQLRGITFFTETPDRTEICVGGEAVPDHEIKRNYPDDKSPSIGVKWYDFDIVDYTK